MKHSGSKLKSVKYIVVFLACIFVINLPMLSLAADSPQIVIDNINKKTVSEYLANLAVRNKFNLSNVTEYQVAIRKDITNIGYAVLFGSRFNTTPEARIFFNLAQQGNNTMVTVDAKIVTNPNSGFEKYTTLADKDTKEIQNWLNLMKQYFNGYVGYGFNYEEKKKNGCLVVYGIVPQSPSANSGLRTGDLIAKINSVSLTEINMKKISEMLGAGAEGTKLTLAVKTPTGETPLVLTKGFIPPAYKTAASPTTNENSGQKPVFGFTNGYPDASGAIPIADIASGGSAEKMGLKVGDKIIRINGKPISEYSPNKFSEAFAGSEGTKVELTVITLADGMEKTVVLEKSYIIKQDAL